MASFRYRDKGYHQVFALSAHHAAKSGVLIETLSPLDRSRTPTFEMRTADGRSLEGVCVVVRSRPPDRAGPERPPGMVVRFIHFDDPDAARTVLGGLLAREGLSRRDAEVLELILQHQNERPNAAIDDELSMSDVTPPREPERAGTARPPVTEPKRRGRPARTIAIASGAVALALLGAAAVVASGDWAPPPTTAMPQPSREAETHQAPKIEPPPAPSTTPAARASASASLPPPSALENRPIRRPVIGATPTARGPNDDPYDAPGATQPGRAPADDPY